MKYKIYTIGEQRPFLTNSTACLARVMKALIAVDGQLLSTHLNGPDHRDWWIAGVGIPEGKEALFSEIAKVTLEVPFDIQLGMKIIPSKKEYEA